MAKKTTRLTNAEIKAQNAAFEKLSPARKRVAIARDALAQLGARLRASQGVYVKTEVLADANREGKFNTQLQKLFKKVEECTVSAKGALFVCQLDRTNRLKLSEVKIYTHASDQLQGGDVTNYLERLFTPRQLELIESAFECRDMRDDDSEEDDEIWVAVEFGELFVDEFNDDELRLRAILENIVANRGTFKPEIQPVKRWVTAGFRG